MDVTDIVSQVVHGLMLTLWLSLPPILVASIVGTLFSLVQALTQAVVASLMRRHPAGGTFHIEDVQDQVELAMMRAGEHQDVLVSGM